MANYLVARSTGLVNEEVKELRHTIAAGAFALGTLIGGCSAFAADVRVTGVPYAPHRGIENYEFNVNGGTYVIPLSGFGAVVQALAVENAINNGWEIRFLADCAHQITFHTGATGCYAHDID